MLLTLLYQQTYRNLVTASDTSTNIRKTVRTSSYHFLGRRY